MTLLNILLLHAHSFHSAALFIQTLKAETPNLPCVKLDLNLVFISFSLLKVRSKLISVTDKI